MNRDDAWFCDYVFKSMPEIIKRLKATRQVRAKRHRLRSHV